MRPYFVTLLALAVFGAFVCIFSITLSHYVFSGFDMSPMIDSGWRVYSGQVPGRDFIVTFPPSLYLCTALFFHLYGVTWHSLALGAAWAYMLMALLGIRLSFLIRQTSGDRIAQTSLIAYMIAQTIPLVIAATLWHATIATSLGAYAIYATFVWINAESKQRAVRTEAIVHITIAFSGLLLSKPNTAYPAILLCGLVLARARMLKSHLAAALCCSVILASLVLAPFHLTLINVLSSYVGLTGRLVPRGLFVGTLYGISTRFGLGNLLVYATCAPLLCQASAEGWRNRAGLGQRPLELLGYGSILLTILGMATNFQYKLSDTPLLVIGSALLCLPGKPCSVIFRRRSFLTASALLLLAFYFGRTKLNYRTTNTWEEESCSMHFFEDPFLGHLKACDFVPDMLTQVDQTLNAYPGQRVFFGASLEFLYAGRNLQSPLHLPNWWDAGSSYPLSRNREIADSWNQDHFDILIFPGDQQRFPLPAGINQAIAENYTLVKQTPLLYTYHRRTP